MAYVILGLLLLRPMSLYDVLKAFEQGVSLFYASSAGSAKRAIDQLLERGEIEVAGEETDGRRRKTYGITERGRAAFREWMLTAPVGADLDTQALPRVYFLGFLDTGERVLVLERLRARAAETAAELAAIEAVVGGVAPPRELTDVHRYGTSTLDYGLRVHRVSLEWLDELLAAARRDAGG